MGTINSSDRMAATLYSLGTLFVLGIHVEIPCIMEIVMIIMMMIVVVVVVVVVCNGKTTNWNIFISERFVVNTISYAKQKSLPI
jgi:hypothetical protein